MAIDVITSALVSHSGSRGAGAQVCRHYTEIAKEQNPDYGDLAWLTGEAETEYHEAMKLMLRYARANHMQIHYAIVKELGATVIDVVDNAHNMATGRDYSLPNYEGKIYRHRKGATPLWVHTMSYIPTTMASEGYVVRRQCIFCGRRYCQFRLGLSWLRACWFSE